MLVIQNHRMSTQWPFAVLAQEVARDLRAAERRGRKRAPRGEPGRSRTADSRADITSHESEDLEKPEVVTRSTGAEICGLRE